MSFLHNMIVFSTHILQYMVYFSYTVTVSHLNYPGAQTMKYRTALGARALRVPEHGDFWGESELPGPQFC